MIERIAQDQPLKFGQVALLHGIKNACAVSR
jgi:hypothetical protein